MSHDIKVKRACFINKNIELNQEFGFCHPSAKVRINRIYNLHFTGSVLWDLFSKEAIMLENSWNTSVRVMFDLPMQTPQKPHRTSFTDKTSEICSSGMFPWFSKPD
jgi:hypothetical protein